MALFFFSRIFNPLDGRKVNMITLWILPSILLGSKQDGWSAPAKVVATVWVLAIDTLAVVTVINL